MVHQFFIYFMMFKYSGEKEQVPGFVLQLIADTPHSIVHWFVVRCIRTDNGTLTQVVLQ